MSDPERLEAEAQSPRTEIPAPAEAPLNRAPGKPSKTAAQADAPTGLQRAAVVARTVLPLAQKLLPLLDGNVVGALVNLIASGAVAATPPADLEPVEHALAALKVENRALRSQAEEQGRTLKQFAGEMARLRDEAEHRERDLAALRRRLSTATWVGLVLLAISIVLSFLLLLHKA